MWQYRWWSWLVVFIVAAFLDASLLPAIFPAGYVPDLILPLVVGFSFFETPRRAALLGGLGGLILDLTSGRLIGLNMVVYAGVGYAVGTLQSKLVRDPVFVPGLMGAAMEVLTRAVLWVLVALFGFPEPAHVFFMPLPVDVLFGLFMTPGLMGVLHLRPRHEVDVSLKF
jgi:rod shape-determining protein MreD